jgi:hypothetical protein
MVRAGGPGQLAKTWQRMGFSAAAGQTRSRSAPADGWIANSSYTPPNRYDQHLLLVVQNQLRDLEDHPLIAGYSARSDIADLPAILRLPDDRDRSHRVKAFSQPARGAGAAQLIIDTVGGGS